MPRKNLANILQAVGNGQPQAAEQSPNPPAAPPPKAEVAAKPQQQASRIGKVHVTGYFDPAVRGSLNAILAQHPERKKQELLAEALNDLFAKYNVPQTARL